MNKKIKPLLIYGILVGLFNIFIGISHEAKNGLFTVLGIICVLSSFSLLKLTRKVKIFILMFSWFVISLYILFIMMTVTAFINPDKIDPFVGVALFFYFPLLLFSIFFILFVKKLNNNH